MPQNVDPMANHWAPDARENKIGYGACRKRHRLQCQELLGRISCVCFLIVVFLGGIRFLVKWIKKDRKEDILNS